MFSWLAKGPLALSCFRDRLLREFGIAKARKRERVRDFAVALFVLVFYGGLMTAKLQAEKPLPATFEEYASRTDLTDDEKYTVELLIESARCDFEPGYYQGEWAERSAERRAPGYLPAYDQKYVKPAAAALADRTWLSFQRLRTDERPIRDVNALKYLPNLEGLVLCDNEISDISVLSHCRKLRRLHVGRNPIHSFAPLEQIPDLRWLEISVDQIPAFKQLSQLPAVRRLAFERGRLESFVGFPAMPELRLIWGTGVNSLQGLQQFPHLQNLVNFGGEMDSLEPLRGAKQLTHLNINASSIRSLEPLAGLTELRDVFISTEAESLDLSPLEGLPNLHELGIRCAEEEPTELEALQTKLTSWDVEFRAAMPRHKPSYDIELIDQATFDAYEANVEYNVGHEETNEAMLTSERDWLTDRIKAWLDERLRENEEYVIPLQLHDGRSQTVVLLGELGAHYVGETIPALQSMLAECRKDWIIFLQVDEVDPEIAVWVFAGKIGATREGADSLRRLLDK